MKKRVMLLGYGLLALVVLLIAAVATMDVMGRILDKESKAFVDAAIPAIVSDWDVEEIRKRASPEFSETINYDDLQQFFDILHGLGELEEYRGSTGESTLTLSWPQGMVITAVYEASADFEAGSAEMQITLIKHAGRWQLLGFKIKPEELNERKDII